jgi:hypothetical protein
MMATAAILQSTVIYACVIVHFLFLLCMDANECRLIEWFAGAMNATLLPIISRLNVIETRLDVIETRLDAIETRLDNNDVLLMRAVNGSV